VCQCGPWAKLWWGLWGTKSPEAEASLATLAMLRANRMGIRMIFPEWEKNGDVTVSENSRSEK